MKLTTFLNRPLLITVIAFKAGSAFAGPHVHGEAQLTVAMEKTSLTIQILAPAGDIVGFEHHATTPQELSSIADAKEALLKAAQFFVISGGRCELSEVSIDMENLNENALVDTKQKSHGHTHHHDHSSEHKHNNIAANYDYTCKNLGQVSQIEVNVFDSFPALLRINSMWINERSQGSEKLSKTLRTIRLN